MNKNYVLLQATQEFFLEIEDGFFGGKLEFSLNGASWTFVKSKPKAVIVSGGGKLYLRGSGNLRLKREHLTCHFGKQCEVSVSGKLSALLDYRLAEPPMDEFAFYRLFEGLPIASAKELILSKTGLSEYCYDSMFYGCTGLKDSPALPARKLAEGCYDGMFRGCTGLEEAPELSAEELAEGCYDGMFRGCTGLEEAPELSAEELAEGCYRYMFCGCTGLKEAPALPAKTLAEGCYNDMFRGCHALRVPPRMAGPQKGMPYGACTRGMFSLAGIRVSKVKTAKYTEPFCIQSPRRGVSKNFFSGTYGDYQGDLVLNEIYYLAP